jgi:hypothetical protein
MLMAGSQDTLSTAFLNVRRSQRVVARIGIKVRKRAVGDGFLSEVSHTLVVNAHGALIALTMKVQPNDLLAIKNVNSKEERQSRVVWVGEEEGASQRQVAVEFTAPAPHFWHIDFPPADWNSRQD